MRLTCLVSYILEMYVVFQHTNLSNLKATLYKFLSAIAHTQQHT